MSKEATRHYHYRVRVSARAKNVNLCVNPYSGLEVVIPKRFDRSRIPQLLQENRHWIEKKLQKWSVSDSVPLVWPPEYLLIRATGQRFTVFQEETACVDQVRAKLDGEIIRLSGAVAEQKVAVKALEALLKQIARPILSEQLESLAQPNGLSYGKVSIRGQKTRWGSCSAEGNISLNYKLLFLPSELVRYVLLHELAHTRFLNHSNRFWELLSQLDPQAPELDRQLRMASQYLPWWANV